MITIYQSNETIHQHTEADIAAEIKRSQEASDLMAAVHMSAMRRIRREAAEAASAALRIELEQQAEVVRAAEIRHQQQAAAEIARNAAEKRKAEAPDAVNLREYLDAIGAIATPAMKTQRGAQVLNCIIGAIVGASQMVAEMEGGK